MKLSNSIIDLYHGDAVDPSNGFHAMKDDGILAVFHKATEGSSIVDKEYHGRQARARATGLLWGAYHFGTGDTSGKTQADRFLGIANPADTEALALDFEPSTHSKSMSLAQAEDFVEELERQIGRYPLLYTMTSYAQPRIGARQTVLSKCGLWVARYNGLTNPGKLPSAWSDFVIWQYTDGASGSQPHRVNGVLQPCDRNYYHGSHEQLQTAWPFPR